MYLLRFAAPGSGIRIPDPVVSYDPDDGGWTLILPGTPIAAEAEQFSDAVDDFISALREYSTDWLSDAELQRAPNHFHNVALVIAVAGSSDDQLRSWVAAFADPPPEGV